MNPTHEPVSFEQESLSDLFRDFRDESINMARQQIELAKAETGEKISVFGKSAASIFSAGLVLYAGLLFFLTSLTFVFHILLQNAGLQNSIANWLAPLITAVIIGTVGYLMYRKAMNTIRNTAVMPEKTIRSLKEDKQWLTNKR